MSEFLDKHPKLAIALVAAMKSFQQDLFNYPALIFCVLSVVYFTFADTFTSALLELPDIIGGLVIFCVPSALYKAYKSLSK